MDADQRAELHRRITLLQERFREGKLHFAAHLEADFRRSLANIRVAADGIVEPSSVDARLRAAALALTHIHDREEAKEAAPLLDIQHAYFARVEAMFGELHAKMLELHVDPHKMASMFASQREHVRRNYSVFRDFLGEIKDFWEGVSMPMWAHTEDNTELKFVFGGELFPHGSINAASLYGFYCDTIVLPDPFLKIAPILRSWPKNKQLFELTRLGLAVLNYRSLALADVKPAIVAVLPDKFGLEEDYREFIWSFSEGDVLSHIERVFGSRFGSIQEASEFMKTLQTPSDVAEKVQQPDFLLFDTQWEGPIREQLDRFVAGDGAVFGLPTAGETVLMQFRTRMGQATDILRRSLEVGGIPVVHAPTSWQWLNWKLEYSSERDFAPTSSLHMVQALQEIGAQQFTWLGEVPPESLIEMRTTGALNEIRTRLSNGVLELAEANPDNFAVTTNLVVGNLRLAFAEHQDSLRRLADSKTRFAGRELGSFVVAGAIELTAAAFGHPLFGVGAAALSMSGLIPTAKELKQKYDLIRCSERKQNASPVGLLFRKS